MSNWTFNEGEGLCPCCGQRELRALDEAINALKIEKARNAVYSKASGLPQPSGFDDGMHAALILLDVVRRKYAGEPPNR
jgi:hypothetical protein